MESNKPILEYIVKHPELTPRYAHQTDSGFDLFCAERRSKRLVPGGTVVVPLGVVFKIPFGYEIQLRPKSGMASKGITAIFGTVDSGYRGELCAVISMDAAALKPIYFNFGEKVCQGVLAPVIQPEFRRVEEIETSTERGAAGFGSTGRWSAGKKRTEILESNGF